MSGGITMPSNKHKFRVSIHNDVVYGDGHLHVMENVRKVRFDLKSKLIYLNVYDDGLGNAMEHLHRFATTTYSDWSLVLGVFPRDIEGVIHVDHAKHFMDVKVVSHTAGFDYGSDKPVQHKMVISYERLMIVRSDMI